MMPTQDTTWNTVTLRPGFEAKAGQQYQTMISGCGRVLVAVSPDSAHIYRRNQDGDYELINKVDLGSDV